MDSYILGALFPTPHFEKTNVFRCLSQNKQNGPECDGWFLQFPQESFIVLNLAEEMTVHWIRAVVKEEHIDRKRNFCVVLDRLGCVSLMHMWVILMKPCTMPASEVSSKDG